MSQIQDRCYFPLTENFLALNTLPASFATNGLVHNPEFEVSILWHLVALWDTSVAASSGCWRLPIPVNEITFHKDPP